MVKQTEVGVSSRFTDGTSYSISLDNLNDTAAIPGVAPFARRGAVAPVAMASSRQPARERTQAGAAMPDLPGSSDAYVFYPPSELSQSKTAADDVSDGLGKTGYTVHELPATIANLLSMKNAAVFVLLAHSTVQTDAAGVEHGGLVTGVLNNDADDATYASDFANGDLELTSTQTFFGMKLSLLTPRIAITGKFVKDHLSGGFAKNAVVFANACFSDSAYPSFTELSSTFTTLGAQYYGWTKEVAIGDSVQSELVFFDRLLGEQYPSLLTSAIAQESPPQKAFDATAVFGWMSNTPRPGSSATLDESTGDGNNTSRPPIVGSAIDNYALFRLDPGSPATDVILAPSIQSVYTYPDLKSTFAAGSFGLSGGTFMLDSGSGSGSAIPSTQSAPSLVTGAQAILQTGPGPGGAGYFSFVASNGAKSNVVALTNYTGSLKYTDAYTSTATWTSALDGSSCPGGSWSGNATGNVTFAIDDRIDLEASRDAPGDMIPAGAQAGIGGAYDMGSMPSTPTASGSGKGMTQYADTSTGMLQCQPFAQVGTASGSGPVPINSSTLYSGGNPVWDGGLTAPATTSQTATATVKLSLQLSFGQYNGDVFGPTSSNPMNDDQTSKNYFDNENFSFPTTFDETAYTFASGTYMTSVPTSTTGAVVQNSTTTKEIDYTFSAPTLLPRSTDAR